MEPWNLQSKFSLRATSIIGLGLLAFITTAFLFYSQNAPAAPKKKKVIWEPTAVTQAVARGTSTTTIAKITSNVDLSGTTVWVVPELAPYITISPEQITNDDGARPLEILLDIAVSEDAPLGVVEGTIHIRKGKKTIAKPLSISLVIEANHGPVEGPLEKTPVTAEESPIPGKEGVKAIIDAETTIYLLTTEGESDGWVIESHPNFTGGDMSDAVGNTFFVFSSSNMKTAQTVVETSKNVIRVYSCDIDKDACSSRGYGGLPQGYRHDAEPGLYYVYAIETVDQGAGQ